MGPAAQHAVFDQLLEGIQIFDEDWRYLVVNPAAETHNRRAASDLLGRRFHDCWPRIEETELFGAMASVYATGQGRQLETRFEFSDGGVGWYELRLRRVPEGLLLLSVEVTERRRTEQQLERVRRLYTTLSEINHAVVRERDAQALYERICAVAVEYGGCAMAWLGLVDGSGDLIPQATTRYELDAWPFPIINMTRAQPPYPPSAVALREGRVHVVADLLGDPGVATFREALARGDLRASASLPVQTSGRPRGVLTLLASEPGAFDSEEERHLLGEMAEDLSFALDTLESDRLRRQWADAFEHCAHGIVLGDPVTNRLLACNPAFVRVQGQPGVELVGMSIFDTFPAGARAAVQAKLDQADREGGVSFEATKARPDGTPYQAQIDVVSVRDGGRILYRVTTVQDISARKASEAALRASEENYRLVAENISDVIWVLDVATNRFRYVSPSVKALRGLEPLEVLSQPIEASITPESLRHLGEVLPARLALWETGVDKPYVDQVEQYRADGSTVWTETLTRFVRTPAGGIEVYGVSRDLTERRALESQLFQAQKLESLGTLSSGIAHDFNNLLAIILGNARLLEDFNTQSDQVKRRAQAIVKAGTRGADLVRQLLTFARRTDVHFVSLSVNTAVTEAVAHLRETLPQSISLEVDLAEDLPPIAADATQFHQVLLNLGVNARDAMAGGGILTFRTRLDESGGKKHVTVTVADTGTGMDQPTRERVFEPFFTTKEKGKGTGLGLSTVFGIVSGHRGRVELDTAPGQGARFTCWFPATDSAASAALKPRAALPANAASATVLVIEDEVSLRELLRDLLESRGHTVLLAENGAAGVEAFRSHASIQVVVSDLGLPGHGGDEVFRTLRALDPGVKFVLASGYFAPGIRETLRSDGVAAFLQKPYEPNRVLEVLARLLRTKETR